ncbi:MULTISPECIES: DUF1501 domain-containing protein [unclassified Sphingomonas]|uniref:DUF1501 domain-containing protein n=1 Tax=unclassified Sphingomonas TaxID=196159 RepID=UPI0003115748|nr:MULTISPECIES: DUF1501 domain-containing protein [unclassified Sphingomonas]KTF68763.1 hypothetical protein ATB93_12270 [Sphingomonas sp. WG]
MSLSRRDFVRLTAGTGALAALGQFGRTAAVAAPSGSYRAMVGIFLFGGNDGWNMVIPTDARHSAYLAARGSVGIARSALTPLSGSAMALHPAMAALQPLWDEGSLAVVLNTGTLFAPLTKASYQSRADLRPANLMSHSDEQDHWQGLRAREPSRDGFLGRIGDRMSGGTLPPVISLAGAAIGVLGRQTTPLILPSSGLPGRAGYSAGSSMKNAAITALASNADGNAMLDGVAQDLTRSYDQAAAANGILAGTSSTDSYFTNPTTGAALTSEVARQLMVVARMIAARGTLGHARQNFLVSQGGYDTHSGQVQGGATALGGHANLLGDLAMAMAGFHRAMAALGLAANVTSFTMSDFGRTYLGNGQNGTDHAWGNNHLVMGGDLAPKTIFGSYPDPVLGGADDITREGRFIPGIAQEEYLGAIARWHGVADADLPYVFPNWSTWSTAGRGPLSLFRG